jgi:hypothetical protein
VPLRPFIFDSFDLGWVRGGWREYKELLFSNLLAYIRGAQLTRVTC